MCKCVNVGIGSYSNQEVLDIPGFMYPIRDCLGNVKPIQKICIDRCLVPTIKLLWDNKIETLNCCCGHNLLKPTVIINERFMPKVMSLGFTHFKHLEDGLLVVYVDL